MAELPLHLAGPVVRRVEPTRASFWIALGKPATVTATVWASQQASSGPGAVSSSSAVVVATGQASTRRFGAQLHVAVVTATASGAGLTPGSLYSYDLSLAPKDAAFTATGLKGLGLLDDGTGTEPAKPNHLALGYVPGQLPSFVMPPATLPGLRIAHASCRTMHAGGPDAMAWLDDHFKDTVTDLGKRTQQLFLTGDQIYADDVASCLLPVIAELGKDLVGAETLPLQAGTVPGTLVNFPAYRRMRVIRVEAAMTSLESHNHLLTFGEFAASYLLAWSPLVWRPLVKADAVLKAVSGADAKAGATLTEWEKAYAEESGPGTPADKFKRDKLVGFNKEVAEVERFRRDVPKVARALANVATYMIFDDHEITDDWNINRRWRTRVIARPLGKAIIRNGLSAYAAFQGWGNDPAAFDKGNNLAVLEQAAKAFEGAGTLPAAAPAAALDVLFGNDDADLTKTPDKKAVWNYRVPGPRHLVAVLDTRTRRKFEGEGLNPPDLTGATLDAQVPGGPMTDGRELLVLISPVPVLGPQLIHRIGQPLAAIVFDSMSAFTYEGVNDPKNPGFRLDGAEKYDAEGWDVNEPAMERLLKRLSGHPRVVILSGDVHYAASLTLDYWKKDKVASRMLQLTSSGTRHPWPGMVQAALRNMIFLQRYLQVPAERLAWDAAAPITLPAGAKIGPGRRARMRRAPALLPSIGWPSNTTVPADKGPDWRWRLRVLRDERPLLPNQPALPSVAELPAADPIAGYGPVVARHATVALQATEQLRTVLFIANVGLVSFAADGADFKLRHALLSQATPAGNSGAENTIHEASLQRSSELPPQLRSGV